MKQTASRTGLHTLSTAWARAQAGPVLPGELGNWDTGFQEAVPGEGGQGAALQDQLGVSLHGLDWRQTGREQRTRTDTHVDRLDRLGHKTRGLEDQGTRQLGHTPGWAGRGRSLGGRLAYSLPAQTYSVPPILRPHIWVGHRGLSTEPLGSSALPPRVVGRSLGPWHGAETLSSFLIRVSGASAPSPRQGPRFSGVQCRLSFPAQQAHPGLEHGGAAPTQPPTLPQHPAAHGVLTQQRRAPVPQRVALVAGDAEGRQGVESPLQQGLQTGGRWVRGVEQVVHLLAGRPQLENWGREGGEVA